MRLFRQKTMGDWASVFREVAEALRTEMARCAAEGQPNAALGSSAPLVPVSAGELLDKITILEIKLARLTDEAKRGNVAHELNLLLSVRRQWLDTPTQTASDETATPTRSASEEADIDKLAEDLKGGQSAALGR